jgi:hypothetical protein
MTILYAGGEDTSLTPSPSATGMTVGTPSSTTCRSTFTHACVQPPNTADAADPPTSRWTMVQPFTSVSSLWFHAQLGVTGNSGIFTPTSNQQTLIIRSPDNVSRLILRQVATFGTWKLSQRNAAGTITDLVTGTNFAGFGNSITQVDIFVNYVLSGAVQVYFNNNATPNINFSGDPRTDSATQLNQIELGGWGGNGGTISWSELIVSSTDTRNMAVWTLDPQAAGNTQQFTPNTLANVHKTQINDSGSSFISDGNANDLSQWTTPTSAPSGSATVTAIVQEARVRVGATGPQHFDWSVHTGGSDFTGGASNAPTTSFGNFNNFIWATNPNTSAAWALSDITGGTLSLGIKALT